MRTTTSAEAFLALRSLAAKASLCGNGIPWSGYHKMCPRIRKRHDAEQPTKVKLIINGKTARILGLKIPQSLQTFANKIIE
jgi:hypothetical protein